MVAQAIDDVALGHDAGDSTAIDHRQGADSLLAEPARRRRTARSSRGDRLDLASLAPKHCCDGHAVSFRTRRLSP